MNILDLKRRLQPMAGWLNAGDTQSGGFGNGPGGGIGGGGGSVGAGGGNDNGGANGVHGDPSSSGYGSLGGAAPAGDATGPDGDDGPMGPAPDARSPAQQAADAGIAAQKKAEAVSRSYANSVAGWSAEPGVIGRLAKAHQDAGMGDSEGLNPKNPTQTVNQIAASDKVHRALNWGVPAVVGLTNPGFGMMLNAAKAAQAGTLGGFAASLGGGMLGAATGLPGMAGFGSTLARNAVNGESTSMGDAVGSIASGVLGMEGSKAAGVVGSVVGGEAGRQIGKSINRN